MRSFDELADEAGKSFHELSRKALVEAALCANEGDQKSTELNIAGASTYALLAIADELNALRRELELTRRELRKQ